MRIAIFAVVAAASICALASVSLVGATSISGSCKLMVTNKNYDNDTNKTKKPAALSRRASLLDNTSSRTSSGTNSSSSDDDANKRGGGGCLKISGPWVSFCPANDATATTDALCVSMRLYRVGEVDQDGDMLRRSQGGKIPDPTIGTTSTVTFATSCDANNNMCGTTTTGEAMRASLLTLSYGKVEVSPHGNTPKTYGSAWPTVTLQVYIFQANGTVQFAGKNPTNVKTGRFKYNVDVDNYIPTGGWVNYSKKDKFAAAAGREAKLLSGNSSSRDDKPSDTRVSVGVAIEFAIRTLGKDRAPEKSLSENKKTIGGAITADGTFQFYDSGVNVMKTRTDGSVTSLNEGSNALMRVRFPVQSAHYIYDPYVNPDDANADESFAAGLPGGAIGGIAAGAVVFIIVIVIVVVVVARAKQGASAGASSVPAPNNYVAQPAYSAAPQQYDPQYGAQPAHQQYQVQQHHDQYAHNPLPQHYGHTAAV